MKERPILFTAPMVRALLNGTKTQTRRIMKMPEGADQVCRDPLGHLAGSHDWQNRAWMPVLCPFGTSGDRLWVRETWAIIGDEFDGYLVFAADQEREEVKWSSPIHMRRCDSRITLEIICVSYSRLQDISTKDAIAEGLTHALGIPAQEWGIPGDAGSWSDDPRKSYRALWESIHGPGSWDANPWVWVIEFKAVPNSSAPSTEGDTGAALMLGGE